MKKTFLFYSDWIDYTQEMTLSEKGLFFETVLKYQNDQEIGDIGPIKYIRPRIKKQIDDDNNKRNSEVEKRKEAGKLGGLAKASKTKQKLASAKNDKKILANLADNENDNDNVLSKDNIIYNNSNIDSTNITTKENIYTEDNIKVVDEFFEIQKQYPSIKKLLSTKPGYLQNQYKFYRNLEKQVKKNGYTTNHLDSIIAYIPNDAFWCDKIQSIEKLTKKQEKTGLEYWLVIADIMTAKGKKQQTTRSDPSQFIG